MMDVTEFAKSHVPQITAVTILVSYGIARKKFSPGGLVAGVVVSLMHMVHPWPAVFWLLTSFVFLGTLITKVTQSHAAYMIPADVVTDRPQC
jgi:uncharacterized membrane protein